MKLAYTEEELQNVDSAIPIEFWKDVDTSVHVMDFNGNGAFGKLVNLKERIEWKKKNIG